MKQAERTYEANGMMNLGVSWARTTSSLGIFGPTLGITENYAFWTILLRFDLDCAPLIETRLAATTGQASHGQLR